MIMGPVGATWLPPPPLPPAACLQVQMCSPEDKGFSSEPMYVVTVSAFVVPHLHLGTFSEPSGAGLISPPPPESPQLPPA
jgi:hypothetical protein